MLNIGPKRYDDPYSGGIKLFLLRLNLSKSGWMPTGSDEAKSLYMKFASFNSDTI